MKDVNGMKKRKTRRPSSNRQGTKIEKHGKIFKSKLEVYCYERLKEEGIDAPYEEVTFEILPEIQFEYNDKKTKRVLSLSYTPDFVGKDFIIECKGYADKRFPVVWKLFKHYLKDNNLKYQLYKPMGKKDVDEMIKKIKNESDK